MYTRSSAIIYTTSDQSYFKTTFFFEVRENFDNIPRLWSVSSKSRVFSTISKSSLLIFFLLRYRFLFICLENEKMLV